MLPELQAEYHHELLHAFCRVYIPPEHVYQERYHDRASKLSKLPVRQRTKLSWNALYLLFSKLPVRQRTLQLRRHFRSYLSKLPVRQRTKTCRRQADGCFSKLPVRQRTALHDIE